MNKKELSTRIAPKMDLSIKDMEMLIDLFLEEVMNCLVKGEKVHMVGFGVFGVRQRAARKGKNPKTGGEMQIDECIVPVFRPGKHLKARLKAAETRVRK